MRALLALSLALAALTASATHAVRGAPSRAVLPAGAMHVPRAVHTATRLAGGDVLIVGGCTVSGCELGGDDGRTAEIFDAHDQQFVRAGELHEWRDDHVAALLRDGRVLVAGGWGANGVIATSELYDPARRTFVLGPRMRSRRAGATATVLRDGRVLIAGGFTDNRPTVAGAEVFVPGSDRFRAVGRMSIPRGAHVAALLSDGRVLIAGGLSNGRVVASTELFDPRTGRFSRGPSLKVPRYKAAAITLADGRALIIGGSADIEGTIVYRTTEIYDPRWNRFRSGPRMRHARYKLTGSVVLLPDNRVFVAGGAETPELFDPVAARFQPVQGGIDTTRLFLTATLVGDGSVLLVGGYDLNVTPTGQAWRY